MSPKLRATAAEALFAGRPGSARSSTRSRRGTVGRADVDPARLDLLKTYPDAAVRARAAKLFVGARCPAPGRGRRLSGGACN